MIARRIRTLLSTKLGQCPYCMRWSALGTLVGWIGVGFLALARVELIAFLIALAIALGFTTLIGLHLAVFTARVLRVGQGIDADRRRFLRTFVKVGSAVFAVAVAGSIFRRTALGGENTGNSACARLCDALFPPGVRRGRCKSDGTHGRGICFTGTCVPSPQASEGFKPKNDPEAKLQALIDGDAIPSTIAGAFFHLARRFQQGNAPANELERSTFGIFERLAPNTRAVLECAVDRFDRLSPDRRSRVFGSPFAAPITGAISVDDLRAWFAQELIARHGDCKDERPGQMRPIEFQDPIEGNTVTAPIPWICRLNGRRTAEFITEGGGRLSSGDYTDDELERSCSLGPGGELVCEPRVVPGCPGDQKDGVCLRVPDVAPGEIVSLEGFNFFSLDARVLLDPVTASTLREVAGQVCGDTRTPVTETVGGAERVIADCRVGDVLRFQIPEDLAEGIYRVTVIMPNDTGEFPDTPEFFAVANPAIRVRIPFAGRIQIHTETLTCQQETQFNSVAGKIAIGSDEVRIQVFAVPYSVDGSTISAGTIQQSEFSFDDVDSGDTRDMTRLIFDGSGFDALGVVILGFEVDNEDAYREMIEAMTDVVTAVIGAILTVVLVFTFGPAGALIAAIVAPSIAPGVAAAFATILSVVWMPVDLIIQDAFALTATQVAELTSVGFPVPPDQGTRIGAGPVGMQLVARACQPSPQQPECTGPAKTEGQYRELRSYTSFDEFSIYRISLRYNRVT